MNEIILPNFNPVAEARLQSLSEPGIRICGPKTASLDNPFTISGRFIVSEKEFR